MEKYRGPGWQSERNNLNSGHKLPLSTKILLGCLIVLGVVFISLWLMREDLIPVGEILFSGPVETRNQSVDATVSLENSTQPTMTIPVETPWLTALSSLTIYNGPGEAYSRLGLLESGEGAEVVGISQDGDWWAIRVPYFESGWGWVSVEQVIANNTEGISVVSNEGEFLLASTPGAEKPTVTALANVNVRSGPGMEFIRIGLLANGQTAEILGKDPEGFWWAIKLPDIEGGQGWVSGDYVVARNTDAVPVIGSSSVENSNIPTPAPGEPFLTTNVVVNIRSGPGIGYAIIGKLAQGQIAEIIGISSDGLWWAIKLPDAVNSRGWVSVQYVKEENTENVPVLQ